MARARVIEYKGEAIVPSTYDAAEKLAGFRLDRRRNYAILKGEVCESVEFKTECGECEGFGCNRCGGTGKQWTGAWVPARAKDTK